MKVIKKINNNVAICIDNNGQELIAFGNGIGFPHTPYELSDLSKIDRTFYGINPLYINLIDEIPEHIFEVSARLVNIARSYLNCDLNNNLVFTLADHINFAIARNEQGFTINNPLSTDIQYFYEKEVELGEMAVKMIKDNCDVQLPKEEITNIAFHFINAEAMKHEGIEDSDNSIIIDELTQLLEDELRITIKKDSFNYSRFVSHLQYLLKRKNDGAMIISENVKIYENVKKEFPMIYECILKMNDYFINKLNWKPSKEELLYLMLHVNRLYVSEDCNP